MKKQLLIIILFVIEYSNIFCISPVNFAVMLSCRIDTLNGKPVITIKWEKDIDGYRYIINRKLKDDISWHLLLDSTDKSSGFNSYTDTTVEKYIGYEYSVTKYLNKFDTTQNEYYGFGYLYAGIELPLVEKRGKVLLLVDNTLADSVSNELDIYEKDLMGDGWTPIRVLVPRQGKYSAEAVNQIKNLIKLINYQNDNQINAIILLGRIAVPYSGLMAPDGHAPAHFGAWPSDCYYGINSEKWTDTMVSNTQAERFNNWNVPLDGKFDQNIIPSSVKIPIGRVDFYDLEALKESEAQLLKKYLIKNHNYRHGIFKPRFKGLLDDGFRMYSSEAFASSAFMNFSAILGPKNIDSVFLETIPRLDTSSYLWSYGDNQGAPESMLSIAYIENYPNIKSQAVFTSYFGSWFGDWNLKNNLLRGTLGSKPSILLCFWGARPFWFYHHLSMGETIGYCELVSQNNNSLYLSTNLYGKKGTHPTILGDPTLRMYMFDPPANFKLDSATENEKFVWNYLSWTSTDSEVIGYNVYWSRGNYEGFIKLNVELIKDCRFIDLYATKGKKNIYQIRAVKLQKSVTGTFYNQSQGVFLELDE
jgi:hypothetical protein